MDAVLIIVFLLAVLVGVFFWASAIAAQAQNKGRSFNAFFWLSFLVSPIIMQIIVATIQPLDSTTAIPSRSKDSLAEIAKLKELMDAGAINQVEFEQQKEKLLKSYLTD